MFKNMLTAVLFVVLMVCCGCGILFLTDEDLARRKFQHHKQEFRPYEQQNTIAAYKEFLAKHPKNMFAGTAQKAIVDLEFSPYEKRNTIEGYMEFKMLHPDNPHVDTANWNIEQIEIKRYDKMDTIAGYKEFLVKYPESIFAVTAKKRLQELEIRGLDNVMRTKYGLDLLKYRLHIRRLKKKLQPVGEVELDDFTPCFSMLKINGKKFFHTHLLYSRTVVPEGDPADAASRMYLENVLSPLLVYLEKNMPRKKGISGFSFDAAVSPHRFYGDRRVVREWFFSVDQTGFFVRRKLSGRELLAAALPPRSAKKHVTQPEAAAYVPKPSAPKKQTSPSGKVRAEKPKPVPKDGPGIMQMAAKRARGDDLIMACSWKLDPGNGRVLTIGTLEKRKNCYGKKGFFIKSLMKFIGRSRYGLDAPAAGIAIHNHLKKGVTYWYMMRRGDAGRTTNIVDRLPGALEDFFPADYVLIHPSYEDHRLVRFEEIGGIPCAVVESVPRRKHLPYGRRVSTIDMQRWVPITIDYFDKKDTPWKKLHITWQQAFGIQAWKEAMVENLQNGSSTTITVTDVRVNLNLPDRDFTKFGLERFVGQ